MAEFPPPSPSGWSQALQDRMQDEAQFNQAAMKEFMRTHGGMTPLQWALFHFPIKR